MNSKLTRDTTRLATTPLVTAKRDDSQTPRYRRRFHVMAKPGGAKCNIDCQYCFYLHKEALLHQPRQPQMSDELLEQYIKDYIDSQDGEEVVFSWQGGEPTLLGLDYFKKIVRLQAKHRRAGLTIQNDLQTNGLLLNDEWCQFLAQHDFLVGLSIDGPEAIHDRYRVTRSGKPTFQRVMDAVARMKAHRVRFNALVTVNRHNAKYPLEVYRFLVHELGVTYIQFTPCVEPRQFKTQAPQFFDDATVPVIGSENASPGHPMSVVTDWSVDPLDWGRFLAAIFEEWINHDLGRVMVNLFETALAQVMGKPAQICVMSEFCGKALAIEHNGDFYSCDHFVYPEYKLGNIRTGSLSDMALSVRQEAFGMSKRDSLPNYCRQCPHLKLCWGECPKNRLLRTPDGELGLNYLCAGFKHFFDYATPILVGLATLIQPPSEKAGSDTP